jgi:hypothetical protein
MFCGYSLEYLEKEVIIANILVCGPLFFLEIYIVCFRTENTV